MTKNAVWFNAFQTKNDFVKLQHKMFCFAYLCLSVCLSVHSRGFLFILNLKTSKVLQNFNSPPWIDDIMQQN